MERTKFVSTIQKEPVFQVLFLFSRFLFFFFEFLGCVRLLKIRGREKYSEIRKFLQQVYLSENLSISHSF